MTKKTLLMFAATSLITPVAMEQAMAGRATTQMVLTGPQEDTAPVSNGRLRRTDSEQAGLEQPSLVMLDDGTGKKTKGLYFVMATELPATTAGGPVRRATDRVQLAVVPFTLAQAADGSVIAQARMAESKYVTNNDGDEYRNAHKPHAFALTNDIACVDYNYQVQGGNDTKRYTQCFNANGDRLLDQTLIFAKNNDDCSMHQTSPVTVTQRINNEVHVVEWHGCNGNGRDDGWGQKSKYTIVNNGTAVTYTREFDISLAPREERSRGFCSVAAKDPNTAICTWTEGNNQPQRDGTWMAAIDITPGKFSGADRQQALLWKEQIEGRKDIDGLRTYSMRVAHTRIMAPTATGELEPTDQMLVYTNDLRGNNNTNEKGGTIYRTMMGVIKADKNGMSYVLPLQDTSKLLRGLGGTHLGMNTAVFGTTDKLMPGAVFTNGSHTGGYFSGQARSLLWDQAANKFIDGGMVATAESDRHLYSNYLGNNPGNQGRNHDAAVMIPNPFVGQNTQDAYLMLVASTGKPMAEVGAPEKKPSGYITVIPVAQAPAQQGGSGSGSGSNPDPTPEPTPEGEDPAAGDSLGGCSTGGTTGGLATFALIGLAAFIRRRK